MISRILPFLNKIVPLGLAAKGLEKVNPKMKSFFSGALAAGYTADQAMDFLRDQFSSGEQSQDGSLRPDELAGLNRRKQEEAPSRVAQGIAATGAGALGGLGAAALTGLGQQATQQAQNAQPQLTQQQTPSSPPPASAAPQQPPPSPQSPQPAQPQQQAQSPGQQPVQGATAAFMQFLQKHPELGNFITKEIQSGLTPVDAALNAKGEKKLKSIIDNIESSIGEPLENIIAQLFNMNMGQKNQSAGQNTTQNSQASGQNTTQSGNVSPAMTQFMLALQEFKKLRSGK